MVWRPRPVRSGRKKPHIATPPEAPSAPAATPPLAAKEALATRENQGNLAPVNDGGRFLSGADFWLVRGSLLGPDLSQWNLDGSDLSRGRVINTSAKPEFALGHADLEVQLNAGALEECVDVRLDV